MAVRVYFLLDSARSCEREFARFLYCHDAFITLDKLANLKRVGMYRMELNHMPKGFDRLDQVELFWLTFNTFDVNERNRIQSLLPEAKIEFQ